MSYETRFFADYELGGTGRVDSREIEKSTIKALTTHYGLIAYPKRTERETIDDWFDFIINGEGRYISQAYSNINLHLLVAKQYLDDALTNHIKLTLEWDGEEKGDYTKKVYNISKHHKEIKITTLDDKNKEVEISIYQEQYR